MTELNKPLLVYKIHHQYDIGNLAIFVSSRQNPTVAAVYCQFMAEEWFDEGVTLSNLAIANALVSLYDCYHAAECSDAIDVDMHTERESACGDGYAELKNSGYERDMLKTLLAMHIPSYLISNQANG